MNDCQLGNVTNMQSRDSFVGSAVGTIDTAELDDSAVGIAVHVASVTTQQMRHGGKMAKLTVQYLRRNVSVVSGSGGNVLVLAGPDGKLIVDGGFAASKDQMSEAFDSISTEPLRFLINTHWHCDHTDGNEWIHGAGATIFAHEKSLLRMHHKQSIPGFAGVYPPSPPAALPTVTFDRTKELEVNGQKLFLARYTPYSTAVIFEANVKAPASRPSRAANASEIIWTGRISSMGCRTSQTAGT
jgi:hypothetical protein